MNTLKLLALAALPLFAAPAAAQDIDTRDLTVEQADAAQVGSTPGNPRPGSLQVSLAADHADATYSLGENVRLVLTSTEDAYVTVLDIGPTGQVTQLFPNRYQPDNRVSAGSPVEIGGNSGARVTVAGPAGAELVKVIASSKPMTVVADSQLTGIGAFRVVNGGVKTVLRDLQVVADQASRGDARVAWTNVPLHTVAGRGAPAVIVVPGQAAAPQASIPVPQPFPLLVAIDRPSYRNGDRVTLAVTALQACSLTVVDFTTSGQVRTLFPNPTAPNSAIGAMQTVLVAGGPSAVSLPVSGPAGAEQIVAVCTTDSAQAATVSFGTDRAAMLRDLNVVAARPAGTVAIAGVTFTVQP